MNMNTRLQQAIDQAFAEARTAMQLGDVPVAYRWLERAHVLTQRMPLAHTKAHWWMLRVGWLDRDWREVAGQVPRIFAALVFSRIWVPVGNTGRARVSAFRVMGVEGEVEALLRGDG